MLLSGSAITIQGVDICGLLPAGRSPISLSPSATLRGTANFSGNPSTPQSSPLSLNLPQQINALKKGATHVSADLIGVNLGSASSPVVQYAELSGGMLTVSQVTGYGILLVNGHVTIAAPFQWEGLIIVSGQVTFAGGVGSSILNGALYGDRIQVLNNNVRITLDTCPISATLRTLPVQVLTWRQLL